MNKLNFEYLLTILYDKNLTNEQKVRGILYGDINAPDTIEVVQIDSIMIWTMLQNVASTQLVMYSQHFIHEVQRGDDDILGDFELNFHEACLDYNNKQIQLYTDIINELQTYWETICPGSYHSHMVYDTARQTSHKAYNEVGQKMKILPAHISITMGDTIEDDNIPDIPDSELHPEMIRYRDKILSNSEWALDQKVRAIVYNDFELNTSFDILSADVSVMLMVFESKRIGCQRQMNTHPKGSKYVRNVEEIWKGLIDILVEWNISHGPDEILIDA